MNAGGSCNVDANVDVYLFLAFLDLTWVFPGCTVQPEQVKIPGQFSVSPMEVCPHSYFRC